MSVVLHATVISKTKNGSTAYTKNTFLASRWSNLEAIVELLELQKTSIAERLGVKMMRIDSFKCYMQAHLSVHVQQSLSELSEEFALVNLRSLTDL